MQVSRASDYGLRALTYLAEKTEGHVCTVGEIARARHIPRGYLAKVMPLLMRANLVRSTQGPRGGYRLARRPGNITLLEALAAIEGPIALGYCSPSSAQCCPTGDCGMSQLWARAQKVLVDCFGRLTFADLARSGRGAVP